MPRVLVVDDDRTVQLMIRRALRDREIEVVTAGNIDEATEMLSQQPPDVLLLDIILPGISGLDGFERIRQLDPKLPVIFVTSDDASGTAIEAMKLGAHDILLKPLDLNQVCDMVEQALDMRRLMNEEVVLPDSSEPSPDGEQMIGRSSAMQAVFKAIGRVAPQDIPVLVRGESGTGKELVARAIYHHSKRHEGPFLAVNCAALPDQLLESELFGHEKGAFTGADRRRIGKFEQSSGGTIFLDEIGDMSLLVQAKVLRLLQDQKFERVGGNETIQTDVRVIAATNRDLEQAIADGEFREDLYYRLNGFTIELPPLRERGEDIKVLIEYFLQRANRQLGKSVKQISPEAMQLLLSSRWAGNVRELQSAIRQAVVQASGSIIIPEYLPEHLVREHSPEQSTDEALSVDLESFVESRIQCESNNLYEEVIQMVDRYLLTRVLTLTEGNKSKAAEMLGITRGSLRHKIRTLNISIGQVVTVDETDEVLEEEA